MEKHGRTKDYFKEGKKNHLKKKKDYFGLKGNENHRTDNSNWPLQATVSFFTVFKMFQPFIGVNRS